MTMLTGNSLVSLPPQPLNASVPQRQLNREMNPEGCFHKVEAGRYVISTEGRNLVSPKVILKISRCARNDKGMGLHGFIQKMRRTTCGAVCKRIVTACFVVYLHLPPALFSDCTSKTAMN
jgi:hypothetical protein